MPKHGIKIVVGVLTTLEVVFFFLTPVEAHPGRTASDGCHYCRTNCSKWGVPWNQRHCHGGYRSKSPPIVPVYPSSTPRPKPTLIPKLSLTPIPSNTLIPLPTNTPSPTLSPSSTPITTNNNTQGQVMGDSTINILSLLSDWLNNVFELLTNNLFLSLDNVVSPISE